MRYFISDTDGQLNISFEIDNDLLIYRGEDLELLLIYNYYDLVARYLDLDLSRGLFISWSNLLRDNVMDNNYEMLMLIKENLKPNKGYLNRK